MRRWLWKADTSFWRVLRNKDSVRSKDSYRLSWLSGSGQPKPNKCSEQAVCLVGPAFRLKDLKHPRLPGVLHGSGVLLSYLLAPTCTHTRTYSHTQSQHPCLSSETKTWNYSSQFIANLWSREVSGHLKWSQLINGISCYSFSLDGIISMMIIHRS